MQALPERLSAPLRRLRRPSVIAGAVWTSVYVAVWSTGERFDTSYLGFAWQLIPAEILRADPIRSTWYLHIQPPLWNLAIGSILRWSPFPDAISLQAMMFVFGVLLVGMLASIVHRLTSRPMLAVVVAVVATMHPDVLGNAFVPNYELATATMLVAFVWLATSSRRDGWWFAGLASIATATAMTRSLYHPVWVVLVLVIVAWSVRDRISWRTVVVGAAIPVLVIGGWMVKNEVMFGHATLSSWFGMNLQRAVIPVLPADELQALHERGEVSSIALVGPFGNYDLYKPYVPPCTPRHQVPATDTPVRAGEVVVPNFNYECFLPVFDQAGADAWAAIKDSPRSFVSGRLWSARTWFAINSGSAGSPSFVMRSLDKLGKVAGVEVPGVISTRGWGTPIYGVLDAPANFALTLVALSLLVLAFAARCTARTLRRRRDEPPATRDLAFVLVGLIVLWTFVTGITFELGEQARFRTMIDPLVITFGAIAVVELLRVIRGRRRRDGVEDVADEVVAG